jgi:hypothetical protein
MLPSYRTGKAYYCGAKKIAAAFLPLADTGGWHFGALVQLFNICDQVLKSVSSFNSTTLCTLTLDCILSPPDSEMVAGFLVLSLQPRQKKREIKANAFSERSFILVLGWISHP